MVAQYEVYKDSHGYFRWCLRANGAVIASSPIYYYTKSGAEKAIESVKANANATVVLVDKPPKVPTPEELAHKTAWERQQRLKALAQKNRLKTPRR